MEKEWFVLRNDHHVGPYSIEEMVQYFHSGQLKSTDFVWKEGIEDWVCLKDCSFFQHLFEESPAVPPPPPPPVSVPKATPKKTSQGGLWGFLFLCLTGFIFYLFFPTSFQKQQRPALAGLDKTEREKLWEVLNAETETSYAALTEDGHTLWLALSSNKTGTVTFYLTSRRGKVLSASPVEVFFFRENHPWVGPS